MFLLEINEREYYNQVKDICAMGGATVKVSLCPTRHPEWGFPRLAARHGARHDWGWALRAVA